MKNQEFSVREALKHSIDGWWVIVIMAVAGGLIGWGFHFLQPPIYEATSTITISMEFNKWEFPDEFEQYEEDFAFNSAEFIINSNPIKSQIVAEAKARGLTVTASQLTRELVLERRQSNWELHVRDRDPQVAAELANIWAEKSLAALDTALQHAIRAGILEDQISGLAKNLTETAPALSYEEFQVALRNYTSEILQEKRASSGILSAMTFTLNGQATPQESPAVYNPGLLVLAGTAIGFIISLWWLNRKEARRRG